MDDRGRHSINNTTKLDVVIQLAHCTRHFDDVWNPLVAKEIFQISAEGIYCEWLQLGLEYEGDLVNRMWFQQQLILTHPMSSRDTGFTRLTSTLSDSIDHIGMVKWHLTRSRKQYQQLQPAAMHQ